jgi:adenylate cyclase
VLFTFGNQILDLDRRELRRGSEVVAMEPQVFDLLVHLVRNRERVVSKDDLIEAVWGGRIVSESTLTSRIAAVRRAVGDSGDQQDVIRTIARKGFRFVGAVTESTAAGAADAPTRSETVIDGRPAFAVLPFNNMSGDPEQEYFADGISEDLIAAISRWCRFPVIARNSSFLYKGRAVDVKQVGAELGARYLLEGSVRKSGSRVRITAQLIDATTGHHLWSDRYDREIVDIFAIQDEITLNIAAAVEPELLEMEERRASQSQTENLAAYDLAQRGNWHLNNFTATDLEEAQRLFGAAIEADPGYAPAYASMAYARYWVAQMHWAKDYAGTLQSGLELARKAVALDAKDPRGHLYVGQISLWLRRLDDAITETRQAIALNPSLAQAYSVLGYALNSVGDFEGALQTGTYSMRLRPNDRTLARCLPALSVAHYQLGAFAPAQEIARRAVTMNPIYWMGHQMLAASLGQLGRAEEGAQEISEIRRREPDVLRSDFSARLPFRDRIYAERIEEGLIKAGWS